MSDQEPRLTVSYQRWCAALREDDLLFVECLLADVRRLLKAGGTFVVAAGSARRDVMIKDVHHLDAFAARLRGLHQPGAEPQEILGSASIQHVVPDSGAAAEHEPGPEQ